MENFTFEVMDQPDIIVKAQHFGSALRKASRKVKLRPVVIEWDEIIAARKLMEARGIHIPGVWDEDG